jgi:hypothetical protein
VAQASVDAAGGRPVAGCQIRPDLTRAVCGLTSCSCACTANEHEPLQCTGDGQFRIAGRPGSRSVDELADKFGREPTPELAVAPHETCQALVMHF